MSVKKHKRAKSIATYNLQRQTNPYDVCKRLNDRKIDPESIRILYLTIYSAGF